jgi:hypothetical protein
VRIALQLANMKLQTDFFYRQADAINMNLGYSCHIAAEMKSDQSLTTNNPCSGNCLPHNLK